MPRRTGLRVMDVFHTEENDTVYPFTGALYAALGECCDPAEHKRYALGNIAVYHDPERQEITLMACDGHGYVVVRLAGVDPPYQLSDYAVQSTLSRQERGEGFSPRSWPLPIFQSRPVGYLRVRGVVRKRRADLDPVRATDYLAFVWRDGRLHLQHNGHECRHFLSVEEVESPWPDFTQLWPNPQGLPDQLVWTDLFINLMRAVQIRQRMFTDVQRSYALVRNAQTGRLKHAAFQGAGDYAIAIIDPDLDALALLMGAEYEEAREQVNQIMRDFQKYAREQEAAG